MRAQKKMLNMLFDTRGKTIIVQRQKSWLNCVQPLGELVSDELVYLAEVISQQSVEMWPRFSLVLTVKYENR